MQIPVNSANIRNFGFSVLFGIYNRTVLFDTTALTTYNGSGASNVLGIAFSVIDQDGVTLASVDWTTPQIPHPNLAKTWTLDLSAVNFPFLYQSYQIIGYIKDSTGLIYQTLPAIKKVCEPVSVNESGYVPGTYQVIPDRTNNVLTVKELTLLVYSGKTPTSTSKTGILYYPTGTINPVTFTSTPFSNNQIITGENRIVDTTVATYDLLDDVYVNVTYKTDQYFPVTCNNVLGDLSCCLIDLQNTANKHCNDAIGENARQLMSEVSFVLMSAMVKQVNGQDASSDVAWIKKKLNCNCGATSMQQNQSTPINPAVTSIVLTGTNGTAIGSPVINGNTKSFTIASNVYQIVKGDVSDLAWSIATDTATTGTVKYKMSFNYPVMAGYLLTAIAADSGLSSQLNSLVTATTNIDLSNLNGGCVINLSSNNYFLSFLAPSTANTIKSIKINGTTYTASVPLLVNNTSGIALWLNGLALGIFTVSYNAAPTGGYLNILSSGNANTVNSAVITVSNSDTTVAFQKTNQSLIAFLQAVVNYLCNITSLQVLLGANLSLYIFDYNGNVVATNYSTTNTQSDFNAGLSASIMNIVTKIGNIQSSGLVRIDSSDVVPSYLKNKILAGSNISINESDIGGGNKVLTITASTSATQVQSNWTETDNTQVDYIKNKPVLAVVATSGSYNDLSAKPTIPAAQVNSDWNATTGLPQILNLPTFNNGLTATPGTPETIQLGGSLIADTTISASGYQLALNGGNAVALGANNIPFRATSYLTATGSEAVQLATTGVYGGLHIDIVTGTFTPNATSKHGAISGTVYKTSGGTFSGVLPAVVGAVELSGSGNITVIAAIRAFRPELIEAALFTGTITDAVGVYIDDINASSIATSFTNKFAIKQVGTSDVNLFNGKMRMPNLHVYADNTAALAGGLVAGDVYRTSVGVMMVTY